MKAFNKIAKYIFKNLFVLQTALFGKLSYEPDLSFSLHSQAYTTYVTSKNVASRTFHSMNEGFWAVLL